MGSAAQLPASGRGTLDLTGIQNVNDVDINATSIPATVDVLGPGNPFRLFHAGFVALCSTGGSGFIVNAWQWVEWDAMRWTPVFGTTFYPSDTLLWDFAPGFEADLAVYW